MKFKTGYDQTEIRERIRNWWKGRYSKIDCPCGQCGACLLLTQGSPEDESDFQPEQGQTEEVASGQDDEDLTLNRNYGEITPNPAEKTWAMRTK
jgi:hypothetical protein